MYHIMNEWEKENKFFIGERWSFFDKKEKKKVWFGYSVMLH